MIAVLLVPLLISGFIILINHPYHYYRLHRYSGQLLYMKAAGYGFFCVLIATTMAITAKAAFSSFHPVMTIAAWAEFTESDSQNRLWSWFIVISITSILTGYAWAYAAKAVYAFKFIRALLGDSGGRQPIAPKDLMKHLKLSVMAPLMLETPMNSLLFNSLLHKRHVLITMDCGKVYVGVVSRITEPNETEAPTQEIALTPVMSGYRHKETRRICFINNYSSLSAVDTNINIPRGNITHASWFNEDVHKSVDNTFVGPPERLTPENIAESISKNLQNEQ
ncbi:hypothetical protein DFQ87_24095 [Salmonella enterica subsp. enterica serovar Montevideo]|uniref:hypothetical protein n=1 Tax=Salmonella enterica TaxID=28901 RepID=UPI0009B03840|nr:hypothetical protein [Salmonella enterica]EEM6849995.1 hypothetical protein [Salmonella enterica subsp. enterica serovar Montevideo]EHH3968193.1 hypothetical protein [Salmonella enterica subsp. enterica serovar Hadar]EIC3510607.1 hypothetical protein [Salmonella enterica subsp. enterica serovar Oranienburg]